MSGDQNVVDNACPMQAQKPSENETTPGEVCVKEQVCECTVDIVEKKIPNFTTHDDAAQHKTATKCEYIEHMQNQAICEPANADFTTLTLANGETYTGQLSNGQRSGYGRCVNDIGDTYVGFWMDNVRSGFGIVEYQDGNRYEGWFANDRRDGYGRMTYKDGHVFDGMWSSNSFQLGTTHSLGVEGSGFNTWVSGTRTGPGHLSLTNGDIIYGNWFNGEMEGRALVQHRDGTLHFGDYPDMQMTGYGLNTYKNGNDYSEMFRGLFVRGDRNGYGTYCYADGRVLQVEFRNNLCQGPGFLTQKGKVWQGFWENDVGKWKKLYTVSEMISEMFRDGKLDVTMIVDEYEVKNYQWRSHKCKQSINSIRSERITDSNILAELEEEYHIMLKQIEKEKVDKKEIERWREQLQPNIDSALVMQAALDKNKQNPYVIEKK